MANLFILYFLLSTGTLRTTRPRGIASTTRDARVSASGRGGRGMTGSNSGCGGFHFNKCKRVITDFGSCNVGHFCNTPRNGPSGREGAVSVPHFILTLSCGFGSG